MKIHAMEFSPPVDGENLHIRPDFFDNRGQIARNFQFWRRNGDGLPRFIVDRLKILVFRPWFMDLWVKWLKFILDDSQIFLTCYYRDDEKSLRWSDFNICYLLLVFVIYACCWWICDETVIMLICKRCLLIHMNNKDWYFFLWKKNDDDGGLL